MSRDFIMKVVLILIRAEEADVIINALDQYGIFKSIDLLTIETVEAKQNYDALTHEIYALEEDPITFN